MYRYVHFVVDQHNYPYEMIYCRVPLFNNVLNVSEISELNLHIKAFSINYACICHFIVLKCMLF